MFCHNCGKEVQNWKFCRYCGTKQIEDVENVNNLRISDDFKTGNVVNDRNTGDWQTPEITKENYFHVPEPLDEIKTNNEIEDKGKLIFPNDKNFYEYFDVQYIQQGETLSIYNTIKVCKNACGEPKNVSSNILDYVFSKMNIVTNTEEQKIVYNLNDIHAFALAKNGLFYEKDNNIYFLNDREGTFDIIVSNCENVFKLELDEENLKIYIFKDIKLQTKDYIEYGLSEEYKFVYDVYSVEYEIQTVYIDF